MEAWDDIRFLLALVRYGSVRGAATALKVNHTTVSRRLRALESRLGSRLVQRTPDGYVLTKDGEMIFASGEAIERELDLVTQRVEGADASISGKVRVALPDILLDFACPALQALMDEHPDLELEVSVSPVLSDIARRDVDVELRMSPQPPDDLVGKKLARIPVAVYAARQLVADESAADLNALPWIRWQEPWRHLRLGISISAPDRLKARA